MQIEITVTLKSGKVEKVTHELKYWSVWSTLWAADFFNSHSPSDVKSITFEEAK